MLRNHADGLGADSAAGCFGGYQFLVDPGGFKNAGVMNERITDAINVEVDSIIRKAYQRAEEVLKTNRPLLEEIAKQLCQKGILRCEELEKMVLKFQEEEAFA